jgi:hypothetical protein
VSLGDPEPNVEVSEWANGSWCHIDILEIKGFAVRY